MKVAIRLLFFLHIAIQCGFAQPRIPPLNTASKGYINVFYAPIDSLYAKQTLNHCQILYQEIAYDLQVEQKDTVKVIIAANRDQFRSYLRGDPPNWAEAFAFPAVNTILLKSPRWNRSETSVKITLAHEILHVVLHKVIGNRYIPRWLDEGLALFYSRDVKWKTMTALSKAVFTNSLIPLRELDDVISFHRFKAELAYQQSFSVVEYILKTYDIDAIQKILTGLRNNENMDKIFLHATGSNFAAFEKEWQNYVRQNYRWLWLYDIQNYLGLLFILLFLIAIPLVWLRNRKKIKTWEKETYVEEEE
ncbi:hypothetical protein GF407_13555 [candidate division KSB1 bacterium]|nr:hypothetical protein [candidate division KSB1 bacterium]